MLAAMLGSYAGLCDTGGKIDMASDLSLSRPMPNPGQVFWQEAGCQAHEKIVLSVAVYIHNNGQALRVFLDSLLAQATNDVEIILLDDSSTDQAANVCERAAHFKSNVRLLRSSFPAGQANARNAALSVACGSHILFLDYSSAINVGVPRHILSLLQSEPADLYCFAQSERKPGDYTDNGNSSSHLYNWLQDGLGLDGKLFNMEFLARNNIFFSNDGLSEFGFIARVIAAQPAVKLSSISLRDTPAALPLTQPVSSANFRSLAYEINEALTLVAELGEAKAPITERGLVRLILQHREFHHYILCYLRYHSHLDHPNLATEVSYLFRTIPSHIFWQELIRDLAIRWFDAHDKSL